MELIRLPAQPRAVPWPTERWSRKDANPQKPDNFQSIIDSLFNSTSQVGYTYALLIVKEGELVFEKYGYQFQRTALDSSVNNPLPSPSSVSKAPQHSGLGSLQIRQQRTEYPNHQNWCHKLTDYVRRLRRGDYEQSHRRHGRRTKVFLACD